MLCGEFRLRGLWFSPWTISSKFDGKRFVYFRFAKYSYSNYLAELVVSELVVVSELLLQSNFVI